MASARACARRSPAGSAGLGSVRRNRNARREVSGGDRGRRSHGGRRRRKRDESFAIAGPSAYVWSCCVCFRFLRGRARRRHWVHRKQRLWRGLRGRSNVDCASLFFLCRNFRRGDIRGGKRRGSLRPQRRKVHRGELQLWALRLRPCELHDVRKRRQNFGRFLRRIRLDKRLAGMRRMQRLGENGLPRMERIGAAMGERLRCILPNDGSERAHWRKHRRKILCRIVPGDLRRGRCGYRARRLDIPDGRRKKDQERLYRDRGSECVLRGSLVDPAIPKVWSTEKFSRRRRAPKQRDQAGGELLEGSRLYQREPRSRQLRRRVDRNT